MGKKLVDKLVKSLVSIRIILFDECGNDISLETPLLFSPTSKIAYYKCPKCNCSNVEDLPNE
jgi:hypothetical protein